MTLYFFLLKKKKKRNIYLNFLTKGVARDLHVQPKLILKKSPNNKYNQESKACVIVLMLFVYCAL